MARGASVFGSPTGVDGPELPSDVNHLARFHRSSAPQNPGAVDQVAARGFVTPARSYGASKFPSCRWRAIVVRSFHVTVSAIRNCRTQASRLHKYRGRSPDSSRKPLIIELRS